MSIQRINKSVFLWIGIGVVGAGLGVWFGHASLKTSADDFSRLLYSQAFPEFSIGDTTGLARRLGGLTQFPHIREIIGESNGSRFFELRRGSQAFFIPEETVTVKKGGLTVKAVVTLSQTWSYLIIVWILAWLGLTTSAGIVGVRLEHARNQSSVELAEIATAVAHDLRAPVGALRISTKAASFSSDESRQLMNAGLDRIQLIASDLLDRFSATHQEVSRIPLSTAIKAALERVRTEFPYHAFTWGASPDCIYVRANPRVLERITFNLLTNAAEAAPPESEISVRAGVRGRFGWVEIVDRGSGIEPRILKKLRRGLPLTTKQAGVGFGLQFAKKQLCSWARRDALKIFSEVGKGTVVRMEFSLGGKPI